MTLKFFNTPNQKIEEFIPITPGKVNIYSCGPTVYSYPHLGNWAAYIYWDTLVRIFKLNNYEVNRVMNITDVGHLTSDGDSGEDKLQIGAKREGKTAWDVAKFYTDYFVDGLNRLNITYPDHLTKATEYIAQQQQLIRTLKSKGFTYQTSDGIYFDTAKFPKYADFAKLNLDSQKAGARVDFNPEKRNLSDFALWKFSPLNEKRDMEWLTPDDLLDDGLQTSNYSENQSDKSIGDESYGLESKINMPPRMGFPGWHIECSTMAMSILGQTIDIHTGGIDHIPVHHTNEIAQSESATGVKFSNYWLHNNFMMCNGTKISKSLGNVYLLEDIENKGFNPIDFRMLVLQSNYRNAGNFTFEALESAKNRLKNWRNVAGLRHQIHDTINNQTLNDPEVIPSLATPQALIEAIGNDLGTPEALKIIDESFAKITATPLAKINQQSLATLLEIIDTALGFKLIDSTPDISDEAKQIIIERTRAREQKDWLKSDKLRAILNDQGIVVRDSNSETTWEYID